MAVISLPVEPSTLYITQQRRRAAQESAFTGAIQHVVGAGSIWNGYIDLPPILERSVWSECRDVIRKVLNGGDRLRVPIVDGSYEPPPPQTNPLFVNLTSQEVCDIDLLATINKAGTRMLLHRPGLSTEVQGGGTFALEIPWPSNVESGVYVTPLWHNGTEAIVRAALTQATRLEADTTVTSSTVLTGTEKTEINSTIISANIYSPHTGLRSVDLIKERFNLLELNPPVPHMFRASDASADGNWCNIQAQFCEPFVPAVILNDDAIGHTISDRALVPNRIEFASSNVWA